MWLRQIARATVHAGWLYIILLHSGDGRHLSCQISVKARDVHDIIPAHFGILQHLTHSLEGSRVGNAEIGFAVPYSCDHPPEWQ